MFKPWIFYSYIGKDILDLKISITKDHSSLNYRPLNLLFPFTDSTIGHPYIEKDINSSKASIFKTDFSNIAPISESYHKNVYLPESLKFLRPGTGVYLWILRNF